MKRQVSEVLSYRLAAGVFGIWHGDRFRIGFSKDPFRSFLVETPIMEAMQFFATRDPSPELIWQLTGSPERRSGFVRAFQFLKKEGFIVDRAAKTDERLRFRTDNFSGLEVAQLEQTYPDFHFSHPKFVKDYLICRDFTLCSPSAAFAFVNAVKYITRSNVAGDIVECGVWRGGMMMMAAFELMRLKSSHRNLHLFDTFDFHWEAPGPLDRTVYERKSAFNREPNVEKEDSDGALRDAAQGVSVAAVRRNLKLTGYSQKKIKFVKGLLAETLPHSELKEISLLRIDTDFYDSTYLALEKLFPKLVTSGVLIVDDYGKYVGATKAVDDYLKKNRIKMLLNRIDLQGCIGVKPNR